MKFVWCCLIILISYPMLSEGFRRRSNFEHDLRDLEEALAKHFKLKRFEFMNPEDLKRILSNLNVTQSNTKAFGLGDKTLCGICQFLVKQLQQRKLAVKNLAQAVCNIYITLATLTVSDFCEDLVAIHLPIFEYILEHSKILDSQLACTVLLQNKECYYNKPALKWNLEAPPKSQMKLPRVERNSTKPLKILHLTDFHITPDYERGGVAKCGYPLCCKKNLGNPIFGTNAGEWGDYNCDVPPWMFQETMLHLNNTHKDIDFVYFTGDIIDHTVWEASVSNNSEMIRYTFETLLETFPGVPILPVIGNHESAPLDVYPPPHESIEKAGLSSQWLYTLLSKLWSKWLPNNALETVKRQGYYSYVVNKKFKVIALNNNICYYLNWWVLYNTTYFQEQLQFLSSELELSEKNEQFVHIITHIPVGNKECIEPWEVSYNNLIKRFSHIIKGQFYGHTHTDELKIFYDDDHTPINMGYNGASLTPYTKYNPNYKLMTIDPNNYEILDIDTYYFNLTEANLHPDRSPRWLQLYSMKSAYNLSNFSAENFNRVAQGLLTNTTLFNKYWRFYVRDGDDSLKDGCDENCQKEVSCKVVTTLSLKSENEGCT